MDAFFAAIEERDNPQFKNKPLIIGADPQNGNGRGVVSTANYRAREYGIHSAMPITKAWRLSEKAREEGKPAAIFLDVNMRRYTEISGQIMTILAQYGKPLEEASIDEAYLDLSYAWSFRKAEEMCLKIKKEILKNQKLTSSIGLGPNKLLAKIASDMQKPDGLTIVKNNQVEKFLEPLPIRKIPGIGPKTEAMFRNMGIKTVRDLRIFSQTQLGNMLGKWGLELYGRIRGRDDSPVLSEYETKSIGEQETFPEDTSDFKLISERLGSMCRGVIESLEEKGFKNYRRVVLTVRFDDFETKNRSHTFPEPIESLKELEIEILRLILPFFDSRENPKRKLFRLLGVRIEDLS